MSLKDSDIDGFMEETAAMATKICEFNLKKSEIKSPITTARAVLIARMPILYL